MIPLLGAVQVAMAAPTISLVTISSLTEGSAGTFRVSYTATGTPTVAWTYGNGDTDSGALTSYTYDDDGTWTVRVTVTDSTGSTSTTRNVTVDNVAPSITASADQTANEGDTLSLACTATDPGDDTVSVTWDFGDGAVDSGESVSHAYAEDGAYTATCTASDEDGGSSSADIAVSLSNAAPALALTGPSTGTEGDSYAFDAGTVDPGSADTHTYIWTWGDGSTDAGTSPTMSHVYAQDGTYSARVAAIDDDGGIGSDSLSVVVSNGSPLAMIDGDTVGDEGDTLSFSCDGVDPGVEDTLSATLDFGDGTSTSGSPASHTYADDGVYTVRCTITDDAGASGSDDLTALLANVAPTLVSISADALANEGDITTFEATATDPGADSLSYSWDFGDGVTGGGAVVTHTYADNGVYAVSVSIDDGDGGVTTGATSATIANVAPVLTGEPDTSVVEGAAYLYTPVGADPGTGDTLAWSGGIPTTATLDAATGQILWTPTWHDLGTSTFSLEVRDDDGATASIAWTVEVLVLDADGDGISDGWETEYGYDPTDASDAASDDDGDGRSLSVEWTRGTDPGVYDGPDGGVTAWPLDGDEVDVASPVLEAAPATSPVGAALTYDFEVYADEELSVVLTASTGQGTAWSVDVALEENAWAWWRVRADDGDVAGAWSAAAGFFVNVTNEAPSPPGLSAPRQGTTVASTSPMLELDPSIDGDLDSISYTFVLDDGEAPLLVPEVAEAELQVDLVDGASYCWTAYATDEHGLASEPPEEACFTVDTLNQPPSVPVVSSPEDGLAVLTTTPGFTVIDGVDPEGRPTWDVFQLDSGDSWEGAAFLEVELESRTGTTQWTPPPLTDATWWNVRVLTTDGAAESAWTTLRVYVDATNTAPLAPVLTSPAEDHTFAYSEAITFTVEDPLDEDGIARIDLLLLDATGVAVSRASVEPDGTGVTAWAPGGLGAGDYQWQARAIDSRWAASAWTDLATFSVAGEDQPPDPIVLDTGCECGAGAGAEPWAGLFALGFVWRRRRIRAEVAPGWSAWRSTARAPPA